MADIVRKPRIAITMGDPNGIGPEIVVKAVSRSEVLEACQPVIVGDPWVLELASGGVPLDERVEVAGIPNMPREEHLWGTVSGIAGRAAAEYIREAVRMALAGEVDAIATAPINKAALHAGNIRFPGHTEMIAALTGATEYAMMLAGPKLKVVHVSTHVSLKEAIARVQKRRIVKVARMAHDMLLRLGIDRPRIGVAGLNPHAGEDGLFGLEEIQEIQPAVQEARSDGMNVSGPYPPDTLFLKAAQGEFDAVVAMYHDQGHIPLKLLHFDNAINVTLGIPVVRTSVDHGTAFDIAGKGVARADSMVEAILFAARLSKKERSGDED